MSTVPNYKTRPTNAVRDRQDTTLASIILYKAREPGSKVTDEVRDYLNDLAEEVVEPVTRSGISERPGDISVLSLDQQKNAYIGIFNNFTLAAVSESESSISKVHMNFSNSWNTFFFGEAPKQISFSGGFFDTEAFPYYQEFMVAYDKYLSGSKLTANNMRMIISYDGKVVDGYITNISTSTSATNQSYKQFNFSVLAKSTEWDRSNYVRDDVSGQVISTDVNESSYNALTNVGRLARSHNGFQLPKSISQ